MPTAHAPIATASALRTFASMRRLMFHCCAIDMANGITANTFAWIGSGGVGFSLVQDAWYAALAIESGCQWLTADRDYARFPGLDWRSPL